VGTPSFSMAGPWTMTLDVEHLGETMRAMFTMHAGDLGDDSGGPLRHDLELLDPVRAKLFEPYGPQLGTNLIPVRAFLVLRRVNERDRFFTLCT